MIDRHALSIDGGCVLTGLCHDVQIRCDLQPGQFWYVRIADSPALRNLDLIGCPGRFDLEMDGSVRCERIRLPKEGASLLLTVIGDLFPCRIEGQVDECELRLPEGHELEGLYTVENCSGLQLLATSTLEATRGIEGYLRLDQSGRGLQFKRLRPRVRPDQIAWQLIDAGSASKAAKLSLLQPDEFSRLCLHDTPEVIERRQALLQLPHDQVATCRQLVRLHRRGYNPKALWAWRCMVQRAVAKDERPEALGRALLKAKLGWGRRFGWNFGVPALNISDLHLLMACSPTGLTRRCLRRWDHRLDPRALVELVRFAVSLHRDHPWRVPAEGLVHRALAELQALAETPDDGLAGRPSHHNIGEFALAALRLVARADRDDLPDRLYRFARDALGGRSCVQVGVKLHEQGVPRGRDLVAFGLQNAPALDADLNARAMRCLLASEGAMP